MKNILSQDEVDSLLAEISEGNVATETAIPEADEGSIVYDFRRHEGPVDLRIPALNIITERFAGILSTELSAATRSVVDANISSIDSTRFDEFCRSIPLPASLSIFRIEPLRGSSLLVMEAKLVFAFVDTYFGGKGSSDVKLEGRNFTNIETRIADKIVTAALNGFERAWADVYKIEAALIRSETDPQFAEIVTPNDMVIVIRIMMELENVSGSMILCIPNRTLERVRDKLQHRFQAERPEVDHTWRSTIERRIGELHVGLGCSLGAARITGKDLLAMKVNDVLLLNQKVSDPIVISVEGIPKFKGHLGAYHNKKAVRIEERLNKE
jgi:flagellar motor switch protein FliM